MFKLVRTFIGSLFVAIGQRILPKKESKPKTIKEKEIEETIRFTDLSSYFNQLKTPTNNAAASIAICHQLKELSVQKKMPTRLNFLVMSNYDKDGNLITVNKSHISGYTHRRWVRLRDINIESGSIITLIEEMVEAMAQDGWGCMNDSLDQLNVYLARCLKNNTNYVKEHCKRFRVSSCIRLHVSLLVDENVRGNKVAGPAPQILIKIAVITGNDAPVESAHSIYFKSRKVAAVNSAT